MLVPCGLVLGAAYGLILVAGLLEVQRLAQDGGLAGLTAAFYVLTYLGFAAPYRLALASHVVGVSVAADGHRGACGGDRGARSPQRARARGGLTQAQ
jgi:hypothetical protein